MLPRSTKSKVAEPLQTQEVYFLSGVYSSHFWEKSVGQEASKVMGKSEGLRANTGGNEGKSQVNQKIL